MNRLQNDLPPEIFKEVLWGTNNVSTVSCCRRVCKSLNVHITEKKLFANYITGMPEREKKVLLDKAISHFYQKTNGFKKQFKDFIPALVSIYNLLIRGRPYLELRQFLATMPKESFIKAKKDFMESLGKNSNNKDFRPQGYLMIGSLVRLAQDRSQGISTPAIEQLKGLEKEITIYCSEDQITLINEFPITNFLDFLIKRNYHYEIKIAFRASLFHFVMILSERWLTNGAIEFLWTSISTIILILIVRDLVRWGEYTLRYGYGFAIDYNPIYKLSIVYLVAIFWIFVEQAIYVLMPELEV